MKAQPELEASAGGLQTVAPGVRRLTAPNPGPMTKDGTNTYLVGDERVVVIDPGPDDEGHVRRIVAAVAGGSVATILLTHRHRDHAGAAPRLTAATGAPVLAAEAALLSPADTVLADGDEIVLGDIALETVATPGHAADHLSFAAPAVGLLFTGDHVMGWSTSAVLPPDGRMADYRSSLEKVAARSERLYLPGHGPPIQDGPAAVRALMRHRAMRESAILGAVRSGAEDVPAIVASVYGEVPAGVGRAARLTVLAHLIELVERGSLASDDQADGMEGRYRPV